MTGRNLKHMSTSHRTDITRRNDACALSPPVYSTQHKPDFINIEILDKESNPYKRSFLEMVHIHKNPQSMNKRSDILGLNSAI